MPPRALIVTPRCGPIIEATLSLSQNSINQKALDADMSKAGAAIPAEAYPETYSVCMKGDPVCDTAPALTRILTLQSTWQDELNQGRPIHMGYTRTVMEGALDRIAQRINAIGAAEAKGTPLPHGSTVAVTTRDWGPLQIGVAVGAGVAGLGAGWLLGTCRSTSSASPPLALNGLNLEEPLPRGHNANDIGQQKNTEGCQKS